MELDEGEARINYHLIEIELRERVVLVESNIKHKILHDQITAFAIV